MNNIDLLGIGDIAVDDFIKIKEAETDCDTNDHCQLCLNYGGKIPYQSSEICYGVGNSANVAVATSRLGLRTSLISNIGDDNNGLKSLDVLKNEYIDTSLIKINKDKITNYHYVLWYKAERTILVRHEEYEYVFNIEKQKPLWIYLSSLSENSMEICNEIVKYLNKNNDVKLAFQPGTLQIKLGFEKLKEIYKNTTLFICNTDEVKKILNIEEKDISKLIKMVYELGPKIVVLTDGINGSYSFDGKDILFMKTYYKEPIENTGAGDSFSGAFISAITLNKSINEALLWGALNSRSVVSFVGPHRGLLTIDKIQEQINLVPEIYHPRKIN